MTLGLFVKRNSFSSCLCLQLGIRTAWILIVVNLTNGFILIILFIKAGKSIKKKSIVNIKSTLPLHLVELPVFA